MSHKHIFSLLTVCNKQPQLVFKSIIVSVLCSNFGDIYDEDHFIATLDGYVKVVKELPESLMERYEHNISNIPNFRVQAWASVGYYVGEVYPVLERQG